MHSDWIITKRDKLEAERERERKSIRLRGSKTCFSFFEVHCDKLGLPKAHYKNVNNPPNRK